MSIFGTTGTTGTTEAAVIDGHSHLVPETPSFGLRGDPRWPSIVRRDGSAEVIINRAPFRSISETAWNPAARLEEIERAGIELQVVSPMPELFSYWAAPADARCFCSATNEWLAKFVGSGGGRFEARHHTAAR